MQIATQGHHRPGDQLHKAAVADEGGEVRAEMALHILRVIVLEIPVMATVEIHENRHDLAQGQGRLADTLALAIVEQTLRVERLKPLAKVIDFAEHSNESTHRDLRMVQAASWRTQPPYVGPVVVSSPRAYPELRLYEQQTTRISEMQQFSGTPFVLGVFQEPEAMALLTQVENMLITAGWIEQDWKSGGAVVYARS